MDPLLLFPPEVVHQIWVHLKPKDLLACRAVASHWLESVTSCDEAWFTEFSYDWHEYFEMKKTLRRWSSGKVRRNTFTEVKDCVFSDVAFYLLFLDGRLEMHSPSGKLVRVFEKKATDLHRGNNCLMIGVDRDQKTEANTVHDTFITDFVLNEIEILSDIEVTTASPKGFAYIQNGQHFFEIAGLKVPANADEVLHFLDTCVVSIKYHDVMTIIQYLDAEVPNPSFKLLKVLINYDDPTDLDYDDTTVGVLVGPRDYYGVWYYVGDEGTEFALHFKGILIWKSYVTPRFFTQNFLIVDDLAGQSEIIELHQFDDCLQKWNPAEGTAVPSAEELLVQDPICKYHQGLPLPSNQLLIVNNLIFSNPSFSDILILQFLQDDNVREILTSTDQKPSEIKLTMCIYKHLKFSSRRRLHDDSPPSWQLYAPSLLLGWFSTPNTYLSEYEFMPGYAFKVHNTLEHGDNPMDKSENIVHLAHFVY